MRRAFGLLALLLLIAAPAFGTTYYVDGGCTFNGDGNGADCGTADAPAAGGVNKAFNRLYSGSTNLVKTLAAGDILDVRGAHSITTDHTSSANHVGGASFDGWYFERSLRMAFDCSSGGGHCTIKAHNWTAARTGEYVVISGTRCPSGGDATTCGSGTGWTQCATCVSGTCNGVAGTCTDTWFTTDSGTAGTGFQSGSAASVAWAIDASGAPTYGVAGVANLADVDASFLGTRCSTSKWKTCSTDADCYPTTRHGTCSSSQTQKNSYSNGTTLFVHYGSSLPTRPYVAYNTTNTGFDFQTGAKSITIQGFNILNHRESSVYISGNTAVLDDLTIMYSGNNGGSSRAIQHASATPLTVQNSELAFTPDEGIHAVAPVGSPLVLTFSNNWVHDQGNSHVMGSNITSGTPSGILLGDDSATNSNSDYTGTVISGNLISGQVATSSPGYPLRIETASNWTFRDNIIYNTTNTNATCLTLGQAALCSSSCSTDGNNIFNNLALGCPGGFINFYAGTGGTARNNLIYNNTVVGAGVTQCNGVICAENSSGTFSGNLIRNNILYSSGSVKQLNITNTTSSNKFEYNLVKTTASPAITWLNTNFTNAEIDAGCLVASLPTCTGSKTGDPLFTNAANIDYHLQTTSPAKDVGTATGMPTSRTRDINNTIASSHGFPSYADNQALAGSAWDMGIDEVSTGGTVTLTIASTDSPDPVVPGNTITYTLSYQNTGGGAATGVTISDTIPSNTSFVSATGGGTSNGTTVTWNIGALAAGASGSVQMVVTVTSPLADGTIISNSAYSIISNESSSVSGVADTTTVTSLPVLLVSMSDAPDPVLAGSNITYTIFYSNTGTAGATSVVITDAVPVNTTYVSSTNGGVLSNGVVTWTIGAVNAGTFSSVQMVVTASAGLANGATITNSTYTLASAELSTINGTPISTGVIALVTNIPQPKFPYTARQNAWTQVQTLQGSPAAAVVETPNRGQWIYGQASELLTLSTSGTTTDTSSNLLPANAIIEAVVARVTTTITVATDWKLGDSAQAARFSSADSTMTAGETKIGLNHANPTVASADLGPVQASAAKVRVTTTGTPGSGAIRITVFYRQFIAPTN